MKTINSFNWNEIKTSFANPWNNGNQMKPILNKSTIKGPIKHQMRNRSIQGDNNTIFDQNTLKLQKSTIFFKQNQ